MAQGIVAKILYNITLDSVLWFLFLVTFTVGYFEKDIVQMCWWGFLLVLRELVEIRRLYSAKRRVLMIGSAEDFTCEVCRKFAAEKLSKETVQ